MSWSTRPSEPAGHKVTAAEMKAVLDQIDSLTDAGWTDYSSTLSWTSTGTAPAFGNATKVAKYNQPAGANFVDVYLKIVFGSTTTFGTGLYFVSLPVTAHADAVNVGVGAGYALDSAVQEYGSIAKMEGVSQIRFVKAVGGSWASTDPFTFGNGDTLAAHVRYQPA